MLNVIVLLSIALIVVAFPTFLFFLSRKSVRSVWMALGVIVLNGVFAAVYSAFTLHGGLGSGVYYVMASLVAVPMSLLYLLIRLVRLPLEYRPRRTLFFIGGLIVLASQSAPMVGTGAITAFCDAQARQIGNQIAAGLQQYNQDRGAYPPDLQALVPAYLPDIPSTRCLNKVEVRLARCSDGKVFIAADSLSASGRWYYSLDTGQWTYVSFEMSYCR
jgi:hypothetical protein